MRISTEDKKKHYIPSITLLASLNPSWPACVGEGLCGLCRVVFWPSSCLLSVLVLPRLILLLLLSVLFVLSSCLFLICLLFRLISPCLLFCFCLVSLSLLFLLCFAPCSFPLVSLFWLRLFFLVSFSFCYALAPVYTFVFLPFRFAALCFSLHIYFHFGSFPLPRFSSFPFPSVLLLPPFLLCLVCLSIFRPFWFSFVFLLSLWPPLFASFSLLPFISVLPFSPALFSPELHHLI